MQKLNYKSAGVNIDEGNALVTSLKEVVRATTRPGADTRLGGFGSIFDLKQLNYKDPLLVSGTDGVGTKLKIASELNNHTTIGQDLVAMCVNDILAQGAEPLFFLDYFATGKLEKSQAHSVIAGIADGCKKSNCALIGGETAEMPGMYQPGEYDLAGFCVGIVEREQLLPKKETIKKSDVIIGLASSGAHSNGYSLIRKLLEINTITLTDPAPFQSEYETIGELLLAPTHIYTQAVLPLCKQDLIKGIAHITGGGLLENIPRMLPEHLGVELNRGAWEVPTLFDWLRELGNIEQNEMDRTFNMGIGMAFIVDSNEAEAILRHFKTSEFEVYSIGKTFKASQGPRVIFS